MGRAIIFDLDGTLTDSGEGIINCALHTLKAYGLPLPSRREMRSFVGPPLSGSFIRLGVPEDQVAEAIRIYRGKYMVTGIYENYPYPGIAQLLQDLTERGFSLYVATSKPEYMTDLVLDRFDLTKYFTLICGAASDNKRHDKAEVIAYLLEQTGTLEDPVMIGDTVYDVLGAAAHAIPTIGVRWGYGDEEQMREAGAVAMVSDTQELLTLLTT